MTWPVDALNDGNGSGSKPLEQPNAPEPFLIESLNRQAQAMERLADLIPQLIAQNQMLIDLLIEKQDDDEPQSAYLDGSD